MAAHVPQRACLGRLSAYHPAMTTASDRDELPTLKGFLLAAVLWLPAAFFLWFLLRSVVVYLPIQLAGWLLKGWMPELIAKVEQEYTNAVVYTTLPAVGMAPQADGGALVLSTEVDALLYCYGWAVLAGLVMATPMTWRRTFAQLAIGGLVLVPAQAFGVVGAVLLKLGYGFGDTAQAMVEAAGASQYLIAFCYQLGYLILPPVTPVVLWILLNRRFIEAVAAPLAPAEPARPARGPTAGPKNGA